LKWFLIAATYITVCAIVVVAMNAVDAKDIIIGTGICMHAVRQLNSQIQIRVGHILLQYLLTTLQNSSKSYCR
jgi:hypothetical protein